MHYDVVLDFGPPVFDLHVQALDLLVFEEVASFEALCVLRYTFRLGAFDVACSQT